MSRALLLNNCAPYTDMWYFIRLLKETGRYSLSPVYVVGVYSGEDKLGEGFGSSLRMAEFRVSLAGDRTLNSYLFLFTGLGGCASSTLSYSNAPRPSSGADVNFLDSSRPESFRDPA